MKKAASQKSSLRLVKYTGVTHSTPKVAECKRRREKFSPSSWTAEFVEETDRKPGVLSTYGDRIGRITLLSAEAEYALGIGIQSARQQLLQCLLGSRVTLEWLFSGGKAAGAADCKSLPKHLVNSLREKMTTGDRLFLEMQDNPSEVRVAQFFSVRDAIRNAMDGCTLHCSFMEPLLEILRRLQQTLASLRQNILSDTETTRDSLRSLENQLWLRESEMDGFFSEIQRHHAAFVSQRNRMIESNLRLVASIAKKRGYLGLSGEDLIQEGNLALITVAEFFDPTKARFSTFATLRIESSLLRAADNQGHFIGRPVHVCERLRKIAKAARTFLEQFGETASVEQLAHSTGMAPAEIEELLRLKLPVDSLDAKCGQDGLTLLEKFAETHGESDRFESAA